jgi:hypothetical protein
MQLFLVLCNIKYHIFFSSGYGILVVIARKPELARVLGEFGTNSAFLKSDERLNKGMKKEECLQFLQKVNRE